MRTGFNKENGKWNKTPRIKDIYKNRKVRALFNKTSLTHPSFLWSNSHKVINLVINLVIKQFLLQEKKN